MLSIDSGLIVVFVIIWILLIVLTKIFFQPIRKIMREREDGIRHDREAGEQAEARYQETLDKIEADIKAAKLSGFAMRDQLEKEALGEKARMLAEISRECRDQVAQAQEELNQQVESLKKELESEGDMLAEKIRQRLLN